jgi:hypothetical protein
MSSYPDASDPKNLRDKFLIQYIPLKPAQETMDPSHLVS